MYSNIMSTYKIYKIITDADDGSDKFLCYIGSTKKSVDARVAEHRYKYAQHVTGQYAYTTSFEIINKSWYDWGLVADIGTVSRKEAEKQEGKCIEKFMADTNYIVVNRIVVGRPAEESSRLCKEKRRASGKLQLYYEENKERLKARKRKYYEENKERLKAKSRKYRHEHAQQISERLKTNTVCECGQTIRAKDRAKHQKTKIHQILLLEKSIQ